MLTPPSPEAREEFHPVNRILPHQIGDQTKIIVTTCEPHQYCFCLATHPDAPDTTPPEIADYRLLAMDTEITRREIQRQLAVYETTNPDIQPGIYGTPRSIFAPGRETRLFIPGITAVSGLTLAPITKIKAANLEEDQLTPRVNQILATYFPEMSKLDATTTPDAKAVDLSNSVWGVGVLPSHDPVRSYITEAMETLILPLSHFSPEQALEIAQIFKAYLQEDQEGPSRSIKNVPIQIGPVKITIEMDIATAQVSNIYIEQATPEPQSIPQRHPQQ